MRYTCKEMKKAGVAGRQKELLTYNVVLTKTSNNHTLESCPKLRQEFGA